MDLETTHHLSMEHKYSEATLQAHCVKQGMQGSLFASVSVRTSWNLIHSG